MNVNTSRQTREENNPCHGSAVQLICNKLFYEWYKGKDIFSVMVIIESWVSYWNASHLCSLPIVRNQVGGWQVDIFNILTTNNEHLYFVRDIPAKRKCITIKHEIEILVPKIFKPNAMVNSFPANEQWLIHWIPVKLRSWVIICIAAFQRTFLFRKHHHRENMHAPPPHHSSLMPWRIDNHSLLPSRLAKYPSPTLLNIKNLHNRQNDSVFHCELLLISLSKLRRGLVFPCPQNCSDIEMTDIIWIKIIFTAISLLYFPIQIRLYFPSSNYLFFKLFVRFLFVILTRKSNKGSHQQEPISIDRFKHGKEMLNLERTFRILLLNSGIFHITYIYLSQHISGAIYLLSTIIATLTIDLAVYGLLTEFYLVYFCIFKSNIHFSIRPMSGCADYTGIMWGQLCNWFQYT